MGRERPLKPEFYPELFQTLAQGQRAGLPIEQTLKLAAEIAPSVAAATDITGRRIATGASLADAGRRGGLWAGVDYETVRAAEASGTLAAIFQRLADHHQQRRENLQRIRSGMMLPTLLLMAALVITPLPMLVNGELSPTDYLANLALVVISTLALLGLFVQLPRLLRHWPASAVAIDRLLVTAPLLGGWYYRRQLREFFNTLGLLLTAGIAAPQAVAQAIPAVNSEVRRRISAMSEALANGATFVEALGRVEGIDQRALAMVATGEFAGQLDEMIRRYSEFESEATRRHDRQLALLVPRFVYLLVAGFIGWQMVAAVIR